MEIDSERIHVIEFYFRVPPVSKMTEQQLATWKNLAKIQDEVIYLKNGLDIHPSGAIRINYRVSAIYDTEYEFFKFLHKFEKSQTSQN